MSAHRTVVVGTDGSESSPRAVARAGACGAALAVACGYRPAEDDDVLVAGDRGPDGTRGRRLGSVPADATRRSTSDVLVVHTTG